MKKDWTGFSEEEDHWITTRDLVAEARVIVNERMAAERTFKVAFGAVVFVAALLGCLL